MDTQRSEQALARLRTAMDRVETAARRLTESPSIDPAEHTGLMERHDRLKQSVAQSLRELDDILARVTD
jgi:hypothetical protein